MDERFFHPLQALEIGVEQRRGLHAGGIALAEKLDLEAVGLAGDLLRDIAHGDGRFGIVRVAARRDPAPHRAAVPDRFVADHVGIGSVDDEGAEPELAAVPALGERAGLADEVGLLAIGDETVEPGFERAVDRAVFARPGAVILLQPERVERA